jgi:hypothetical protein
MAALILSMGSVAAEEREHGDHDGSDRQIRSPFATVHQASDRHGDGDRERHGDGEHHDLGDGHARTPVLPPLHLGNQRQSGPLQQGHAPIQTTSTGSGTRSPETAQNPPPVPLPSPPPIVAPPAGLGSNPPPSQNTGPGTPPRTTPVAPPHAAPSVGQVTAPRHAPAPGSAPAPQPEQPSPAPGRQFPNTVLIPPLALPAPAIAHAVSGGSISPLPLVVLFLAMGLLLAVLGVRIGRRRTH